jgi:phospholipid/cholesterol/gamma-HCH transport system substrate-binding protein
MKNQNINNAKVGLFVLAGILFFIFTLYMIGKNRNLFGATFTIKASLTNVNGLVPGNNVRFKGIDVGTVKSITVANDTLIYVTLTIDDKMKSYIKKNAIASVATDGLMGNKLININSGSNYADPVEEGDVILSRKPVETDEMLRTLNTTNNNIEKITNNLYEITVKLNSSQSLWTLLSDTVITQDLKAAVIDFRKAGSNTAALTKSAHALVVKFERGNGLAHTLFTDTTLSQQLSTSLQQIQQASNKTSAMMQDLKTVIENMKHGEGTAGLILTDTLLRQKLFKSASNVEQGTDRFNQNMEALKSNFLFRGYFKKLEKEQKRDLKTKKE